MRRQIHLEKGCQPLAFRHWSTYHFRQRAGNDKLFLCTVNDVRADLLSTRNLVEEALTAWQFLFFSLNPLNPIFYQSRTKKWVIIDFEIVNVLPGRFFRLYPRLRSEWIHHGWMILNLPLAGPSLCAISSCNARPFYQSKINSVSQLYVTFKTLQLFTFWYSRNQSWNRADCLNSKERSFW